MAKLRATAAIATLLLAAQAATSSYTLQWGDTLSGVARRFGVSVAALADANGITNVDFVREGRSLQLPGSGTPPMQLAAATQPAATATHTIARGETLSGIAQRHRVSVADLMRVNNIADANYVQAGRQLVLPGGTMWVCPVQGADRWSFIDSFGAPRAGGRVHQGIDIFGARGTPVVANVGGVLRHVQGQNAGNAYYLEGDDGLTYYGAHLDGYARGEGRIGAGEVIGSLGNTGNAATTPPHLHFSMERGDGTILNPYAGLTGAC